MTNELPKTYDPSATEDKLYKTWEEKGYFNAEVDKNKKPFTIVIPPPNVTGQLHMGHTYLAIRWSQNCLLPYIIIEIGSLAEKKSSS